jgi:hypothetical protein
MNSSRFLSRWSAEWLTITFSLFLMITPSIWTPSCMKKISAEYLAFHKANACVKSSHSLCCWNSVALWILEARGSERVCRNLVWIRVSPIRGFRPISETLPAETVGKVGVGSFLLTRKSFSPYTRSRSGGIAVTLQYAKVRKASSLGGCLRLYPPWAVKAAQKG